VVAPGLEALAPETRIGEAAGFAARFGVLPKGAKRLIRGGLAATEPAIRARAAEVVVRLGEAAPELIQDFDPGLRTEAFLIAGLVDSGVDAARAVEMAGDALARNSPADRAERERRVIEENHAAENRRFLVARTDDIEKWFAGRGRLTRIIPELRDAFGEKTRTVFLRTGDLSAAQRMALADLRREGLPEGGAQVPGETKEFDLTDDMDSGKTLADTAESGESGSGGEDRISVGTDDPDKENVNGNPEELQAPTEPGVGDEDEEPEGAVPGADGMDESENALVTIYNQHGVDDETAATLAKSGVEPQIDPELHEDRAALIRAIRDIDSKDGKAAHGLRSRIAKVMSGDMSGMAEFQNQLNRRIAGQGEQETLKALALHAVKRFGREIDPENAKLLAAVMNATPENQQDVRRAVNKRFGGLSGDAGVFNQTVDDVIRHWESGGKQGLSPRDAAERLMPYVDGRKAETGKAAVKALATAVSAAPGLIARAIELIDIVDTVGSLRGTDKQREKVVGEIHKH
jgi:hypothetical protein